MRHTDVLERTTQTREPQKSSPISGFTPADLLFGSDSFSFDTPAAVDKDQKEIRTLCDELCKKRLISDFEKKEIVILSLVISRSEIRLEEVENETAQAVFIKLLNMLGPEKDNREFKEAVSSFKNNQDLKTCEDYFVDFDGLPLQLPIPPTEFSQSKYMIKLLRGCLMLPA
jgi:hypothetical protein